MRSFDIPNRYNYADRYNPIAHVIYYYYLLYKIVILVLNKLYFNFYKILLKGYEVIGDIEMYIVVYFDEEKRA